MIHNRLTKILTRMCLVSCMVLAGCSKDNIEDMPGLPGIPGIPDVPGGNPGTDDGELPDFDPVIAPWNGEKAGDISDDKIDWANGDIYHEVNTFSEIVHVNFSGASASVTVSGGNRVKYRTDGAYVTIDMQTNSANDVEIIASGKSDDGQLKIYGSKKFKLTLKGLELTSLKGPAINNQCKKRVFVHLTDGTETRLTDCASYSDEPYYLTASGSSTEDRKGCFFSEGNLIFSGAGVLEVAGKYRHGIVTDGYLWIRPGVTLVVTEAAKNAIHVKGDATDAIGFYMTGGLVYTNNASEAGKGIKTDLHAVVAGGKLTLNQSGNATYEASSNEASSAAGIKTDGTIIISGGTLVTKSTGSGGKGLNATGDVLIYGGKTTVTTTGTSYYKSQTITSSPKGVKADGNIEMKGGALNIAVTGAAGNGGSPEGIEAKGMLTVDGGSLYAYATDDAVSAGVGLTINDGRVFAHSTANDGIESNGYLHINGGLVIANGAGAPEESFDCNETSKFLVNGGTVIGTGGTSMHAPSSSSEQKVVIYRGLSLAKDDYISILGPSGNPADTYQIPRSMSGMVLFYSSPDIESGKTYTISKNGELTGYGSSWSGWYAGGTWTGGVQIGSFTPSGMVTVVGRN